MAKPISAELKTQIINLMFDNVSQREIERQTKVSRQCIRNLAEEVNFKFPANGVEILAPLCVCSFCGEFFRKSLSRILRADQNYCSKFCKSEGQRGDANPNWTDGSSSNTFSKWVMNQRGYKVWSRQALEKAGYKCEITGVTENLQVHHLKMKSIDNSMALDPNNALVVSEIAHRRLHELIRQGYAYDEVVDMVRKEFNNGN